jgi:hypothetical protein
VRRPAGGGGGDGRGRLDGRLPGIGHHPMEELEGFDEMLDIRLHELAQEDVG